MATKSRRGSVLAVIGGQYGSEGKGVVVAHLAKRFDVHVRTGGPNAGHSFKYKNQTWKMQAIPVGWRNPDATLIIGRGALVNPLILRRELAEIEKVDPSIWERLLVDADAGILDPAYHDEEGGVDGELHKRIGSTGEGVGLARIRRIERNPDTFRQFWQVAASYGLERLSAVGTDKLLRERLLAGDNILLEGSQGTGLSLIHGPWPYVTSHDTNAATLAADCGLPPQWVTRTLVVLRSNPIRVAGNSGPLPGEFSWEELSARLGKDVQERTTVTNKVRRIGAWDQGLAFQAIGLNDPASLALTFADYINPNDEGVTSFQNLSAETRGFVDYLESFYGRPVEFIGTGGPTWQIIDRHGPNSRR